MIETAPPPKPVTQSKTLNFNAATVAAIALFLVALAAMPEFKAIVPVEAWPYIVAAVAAVNWWLRYYSTSQPIKKD